MDREGFRNRLKQYKQAREENPGLKYWEWKDIPKYDEGTGEVLDKNKVYNRVKGDLIGNMDYSIMDAIRQYLFNEDSTVDEYIETIKSAKDKYSNYDQNELDSLATDAHKKYLKYLSSSRDRSKTSSEYKDYSEKFNASKANFIITHEDAKDLYLGLPQRNNTVIQSKYKPSVGDTSQTYYTFTPLQHETAFQKPIVDAYNNMLQNKVVKVVDDGKFLGLQITEPEIENADSNVIDIPKQNRAVAKIPLFGGATVSAGVDPNKGQYVSVYDVWDYNTAIANKHGDNVGKYIGGTPFELYDRIYLDDYYGANSQPNKGDYYGGYLPEITVTATKHAEGGEVTGPPTYEQWYNDVTKYNPTILDNASMYWSIEAAKKALHNEAMGLPEYAPMWNNYVRSLPKADPDIDQFVDDLWVNENPNNAGLKNGKYYPHKSPEGGKMTIGPGFKLGSGSHSISTKTANRGMTKTRLDQEARKIGKQHLAAVDQFLNYGQTTNPADTVSPQIKMGLMDLRHQVGPLNEWGNLRQAVLEGDLDRIKKESTVTWNDNGKIKVDKRRKKIRDEKYFYYE